MRTPRFVVVQQRTAESRWQLILRKESIIAEIICLLQKPNREVVTVNLLQASTERLLQNTVGLQAVDQLHGSWKMFLPKQTSNNIISKIRMRAVPSGNGNNSQINQLVYCL